MWSGCGSLPTHWVVVGRTGRLHRPQGHAVDARGPQASADQPVCLRRRLTERPLLNERTEDVRNRLVQRAGLIVVFECRGRTRYAMRQLVAHNVDGNRETVEDRPVAVAEHHLRAVPERVVVLVPEMDRPDQVHAVVVDRIASVDVAIEIEGGAQAVVGFVDRDVPAGALAFASNQRSGQVGRIGGRVNKAILARGPDAFYPSRSRLRSRARCDRIQPSSARFCSARAR